MINSSLGSSSPPATQRPIRVMPDEFPVDTIPSRVLGMILVTAQECDGRFGVLNSEDITKRLGFEEAETEGEVQELTRESIEAGEECMTFAEGE